MASNSALLVSWKGALSMVVVDLGIFLDSRSICVSQARLIILVYTVF